MDGNRTEIKIQVGSSGSQDHYDVKVYADQEAGVLILLIEPLTETKPTEEKSFTNTPTANT
jgi:hypothetical protein